MTERRPTPEGVAAAAKRIAGMVTRTPLLPLDLEGRRFWVKAECLQQSGSFKLRGASNRLARLDEAARRWRSAMCWSGRSEAYLIGQDGSRR